jgi:HSP20 family protein
MALISWEPATEVSSIQNEMNRLFNTFLDQPTSGGRSAGPRRWVPAMDLIETSDNYVLRADLPGLSDRDVNVQLQDNVLTVSGERRAASEQQQEGYYRLERAFGAFSRSLTLPEGVDADAVKANFDRGVLEIKVPKPEQKKPRQVRISVSGGEGAETIEGAGTVDPRANGHHAEPALAT